MNHRDWQKSALNRKYRGCDPIPNFSLIASSARLRLAPMFSAARYLSWQFGLATRHPLGMIAFRPHPDNPRELQMLGPWPLPDDAGEEEVRAAARQAVAEVDGPDAVSRLNWLPPK